MRLATAPHLERDLLSNTIGAKCAQQWLHLANPLAIPADEYVPLIDASCRPRPVWIDTHDHYPGAATSLQGDRVQAEAEIAAWDASVRLEARRNAVNGGRWDHEHTTPWRKYGHAEPLTDCINGNGALTLSSQTRIEFDARVDFTAT
jgi:hypothetical protein